jgi:hypothetical protein
MKLLYFGEIGPGQTALMRMRELERLGHDVMGVRTTEAWKHASPAGERFNEVFYRHDADALAKLLSRYSYLSRMNDALRAILS